MKNPSQAESKTKRTRPEYRAYIGPPHQAENSVCEGCPFPGHGFLCRGEDGECMRTGLSAISEKRVTSNEQTVSNPSADVIYLAELSNWQQNPDIYMKEPYAPMKPGTRGTVRYVDDAGQLGVAWDNGRSLSLIPCMDSFRKLAQQENAQEQALTMEGMKL